MKKHLLSIGLIFVLLVGCTPANTASEIKTNEGNSISYENSATAGVWLSYSEINSMLKSEKGFKSEFSEVIQNCIKLNITDIYLHVRAFCDSLYKSDYFPLMSAAKNLDFDVLSYAVNEAHSNGIKLHAWINPYRVFTASSDINSLSSENPAYKWLKDDNKDNDKNVLFNNGIYLNPAENEVRELVLNGIREILENYAIDGIHFDDYFYPTTDSEFDKESYEKYISEAETPLSLDAWRRENVNVLIASVYSTVKSYGEDILFTVSPAADIEKNRNEYFADVEHWIREEMIDIIIPQLYFGFEYPNPDFNFDNLLNKWVTLCLVNPNVKLMVGLPTYKIGTDSEPDKSEWSASSNIIARQARLCYKNPSVSGYIFFSYSSLISDNGPNKSELKNFCEFLSECK